MCLLSSLRLSVLSYPRSRLRYISLSSRPCRLVKPVSPIRLVACLLIPSRPGASRPIVSFVLLVVRLVVLFLIVCLVSLLRISSLLPPAIRLGPISTYSFAFASHPYPLPSPLCAV